MTGADQIQTTVEPSGSRSLWAATAISPPLTSVLTGAHSADILVVGAGFTGLVAALNLAAAGQSVIVLDGEDVGWGASGRNNGQVIAGLKLDPRQLIRKLGHERGEALIAWSGAAADAVFNLIEDLRIDCAPVRRGWIQPAYTVGALDQIADRCAQWASRGADVRMLTGSELERLLGSPAYVGGWLDRRGGSIQPLSYARGLAQAAIDRGVAIHSRSAARWLERQKGRWLVRTDHGSVSAEHVVVATAAYSGSLVPGLRQSIVPVRTAQVASERLDDATLQAILPERHVASDTRRLLTSMRISPDGRLVMGGSGATGGEHTVQLEKSLHSAAAEIFAHLPALKWEYGWSGYLAVTGDHIPHMHQPAPALHVALGCNGRGIAVSTAMGELLAARILGADPDASPLPNRPIRRVAFHHFRNVGIAAGVAVKRQLDAVERARTRRLQKAGGDEPDASAPSFRRTSR